MRLTVHETYAFTATGWYGWYGWCLTLSMQRAPKNLLCMNMFVYACVLYTLVYCGFSTCNSFLIGPCKHCALRTRIRKCCERTRISFYFAASLLPVSLLYWRFLHYFEYVHDLFHIFFSSSDAFPLLLLTFIVSSAFGQTRSTATSELEDTAHIQSG